jgi:hypothetical protein
VLVNFKEFIISAKYVNLRCLIESYTKLQASSAFLILSASHEDLENEYLLKLEKLEMEPLIMLITSD